MNLSEIASTYALVDETTLSSIAQATRNNFNLPASTSLTMSNVADILSGYIAPAFYSAIDLIEASRFNAISVYYGNESYIKPYAFYRCENLVSISFPKCHNIGYSAFAVCSKLTDITKNTFSSRMEYIGSYAFERCTSLEHAYISPNNQMSYIPEGCFSYCISLGTIDIEPKASFLLASFAFLLCRSLKSINLTRCYHLGDGAFWDCNSLTSIYISGSVFCSIGMDVYDVFRDSPIGDRLSSAHIYITSSMINTYRTATNWAQLSSLMVVWNNE